MKPVIPLAALMVMAALLLISWSNLSDIRTETTKKYNQYMKKGEMYEEKKIYIDAVKQYESALKLKPENYELAMKITGLYTELEDDKGYISACRKAIKSDKSQAEPYIMALEKCYEIGENKQAHEILNQAKTNLKESQNVTEKQRESLEKLELRIYGDSRTAPCNVDEFFGFHQMNGTGDAVALVKKEGCFGIINSRGSKLSEILYDEIGLPANGLQAVLEDGERFFITSSGGYRKIVPDDAAEELGCFSGTYAPLKAGGKYGYINQKMEQGHFDYDFAGSFENGAAIVQKNGKWGLIGTNFSDKVPAEFDEIKMDHYGFGLTYGVFFGKKGSTWGLYNLSGEQLADGFEDVRMFASKQPAAVKKDGKWGFADKSGKIVIEPAYDDADSFSCGYAPVKQNGEWGCINREQLLVIEPQYEKLSAFNNAGYAYCEEEGEKKFLIVTVYDEKE